MLAIAGSLREDSRTQALTEVVAQGLERRGLRVFRWDLRSAPLPYAEPRWHHDPLSHPDRVVRAFAELAHAVDAFVLGSPVYHNSYSGILKNALDHLAIAQFAYKPVGLVGHGGNRTTQAVDHLRIVVRGLLGIALPTQVCTMESDWKAGVGGALTLVNEDIVRRVERFCLELPPAAEACASMRAVLLR